MNSRDSFLKEFRGGTLGKISDESSVEEVFQNTTLRPNFSVDKKMSTIETIIAKDIQLQNTLKGIVLGLFTSDECVFILILFQVVIKK